jgi:uracil DNA glycosylase
MHRLEYSSMTFARVSDVCIIPPGWETFFITNWDLVSDILLTLHGSKYKFAPNNMEIFRMFYEMKPKDIKVVIIGQSPYADGNACGIPFVTKTGYVTKTLSNIAKELSRQYSHAKVKNINQVIMRWMDEGIFMINMSLSIGISSTRMKKHEEYVLNHDTLWEEFIRELVKYIAPKRKIPIILLGSVAWGLEDEIMSAYTIIKAPFPTRDEFIGSGVFGKCDEYTDDVNWF